MLLSCWLRSVRYIFLFAALLPGSRECLGAGERQPSLGPLRRFDPADFPLPGLITTYGNPRLGLSSAAGQRIQQIGDAAKWCVEITGHLEVIGWNSETRWFEALEVIEANEEWCLDPAGTRLVASRYSPESRRTSVECFDFKSGKSLWTCEDGTEVADAIFTPDGKQAVILHTVEPDEEGRATAVSWFDAGTGTRTRQVRIRGAIHLIRGDVTTDYLGASGRGVYVAVPRGDDNGRSGTPDVWWIPDGKEEAIPCEVDPTGSNQFAQIAVGGKRHDLVAIYTGEVLELFRESPKGSLERISRVDVSIPNRRRVTRMARFTPDGSELFYSDCQKSIFVPVAGKAGARPRRLDTGIWVGAFNPDGSHIVSVDDGGMVLHDAATLNRVDRAGLRESPVHCCPIEEAGFSIDGDWIISSDQKRLILWTKEGEMVAELISPSEGEKPSFRMQSPLVVEQGKKILAADGWQFLEWDLAEILARKKRLKGFYIRVAGKPVYTDLKATGGEPELMTLSLDAARGKLVTATGKTVIVRDFKKPGNSVRIKVPRRDIAMRPRSFSFTDGESGMFVRAAGSVFALDPSGKDEPQLVSSWMKGFDPSTQRIFSTQARGPQVALQCRLPTSGKEPVESIELPAAWSKDFFGDILASPDSKWIVTPHARSGGIPSLAVIDWEQKRVCRDVQLPWTPTSLEFSRDGRRLAVGASNRCVYVFDVAALSTPE